jgi:uncharacterized protein
MRYLLLDPKSKRDITMMILPAVSTGATSAWVTSLAATTTSPLVVDEPLSPLPILRVTALHRYAIKGLSHDALESVSLTTSSFPEDRRYALLKSSPRNGYNSNDPTWLTKENFVCAFTHAELLAKFQSSYRLVEGDQRLLNMADRSTGRLLLESVRLDTEQGRAQLADFISEQSGTRVVCVTSPNGDFQYGNSSSGVKQGDLKARSIHVRFAATQALRRKR